jgi:hypothetical protein
MIKTATAVLVALLATLTLSASAGGTAAKKKKKTAKITGVSFTHPDGASTSFVCAKVKKTTKAKARLRVSGRGANVPDETYSVTLKGMGTKTASFEISAPGPYTFRLTAGGSTTSKSITVTPPPTPANGPFACPEE